MVLGNLENYMQKNEIRLVSDTMQKITQNGVKTWIQGVKQ